MNKNGGVCGRQVEVEITNHGYDPQKAVSQYRDVSTKVLAMAPVLGSPVVTALKPSFDRDNMLVGAATWTSEVLPDPNFQIAGATYDLETINAIDWLTREKGLKKGDSIGIVYFEGDFGGNASRVRSTRPGNWTSRSPSTASTRPTPISRPRSTP